MPVPLHWTFCGTVINALTTGETFITHYSLLILKERGMEVTRRVIMNFRLIMGLDVSTLDVLGYMVLNPVFPIDGINRKISSLPG
jgi:hypothetical protein